MKFPFDWLLLNRWFWITILGCWAVMVGPLVIITLMIYLPTPVKLAGLFGLLVGGGAVGGYNDWVKARRQEQKVHPEEYES